MARKVDGCTDQPWNDVAAGRASEPLPQTEPRFRPQAYLPK